ncbi:cellulose biosynthesis protein BcsQ [Castellaniella sp. UC4442_H9]|nr:cellulose biosynthesis protein BcsQ [Castellaniella sp.]
MNLVTVCGIRGGVGASTIVAMLGDALHAQEQRILMVDLNASDLLRLHFNVPYSDDHGWVSALFPKGWRQQAFRIAPGLCLAPFGRRAIEKSGLSHLLRGEGFWLEALADLEPDFDWVLFDCPALPYRMAPALRFRSTLDMLVAHPDVAAHVLLAQLGLGESSHLLVNGLDPGKRLECDIVADWHHRYGARVLPFSVYQDECFHEALACKTTPMRYQPDSVPSQTARSLAAWCLENR